MARDEGVTITNREIYDQVMATKEVLSKLVDKVDTVEKRDGDHETRLRSLERWRWALAGVGAALGGGGGAVVTLLTKA